MPDYSTTRSEYLKIMMGNTKDALAPYRPEQINDVGGTSFDVASLSDDDINQALENMTGTNFEGSDVFNSLVTEKNKRSSDSKKEEDKPWWQQIGDFFSNIGTSITEGVLNVVDSVWDFTIGVAGGIGGGWFGQQNDFTDWVANAMTDDRWISYATKGLTQMDIFDTGFWTNEGGYWSDWSYENIKAQEDRDYEGMEWLRKGGNFVGELIPSLVLAYFTGGASLGVQAAVQGGLGFARAYGNAASQALNEGATFQQASGYGALSGSIEAAFSAGSAAVGGMLASKGSQGFMKVASNKFAESMTQRFGQGIGTAAGKAMEIALDALGEATEETVENLLDPAFRMVYDQDAWYNAYGTDENRAAYLQEVGKAALIAAAGSVVAGVFKTGVEIKKVGTSKYVADYQSEIEASSRFRALKKVDPELAQKYITGQLKYAKLQQEEVEFQKRIENITKKAIKNGQAVLDEKGNVTFTDPSLKSKVEGLIKDHTISYSAKYIEWGSKYQEAMERSAKMIRTDEFQSELSTSQTIDEGHVAVVDTESAAKQADLSEIPVVTEPDANGMDRTFYTPEFTSTEDLGNVITAIQESKSGTKIVKLPVSPTFASEDVLVDVSKLTPEETISLREIKSEDLKVSDDGSTKYADLSGDKIIVFDGEDAGLVEAVLSDDGSGMVFKFNGMEIPAGEATLTAKQEVEGKYGKGAAKSQPSVILEVAEGKDAPVWSFSDTRRMVGTIDDVIKDMFDDNSLPAEFRETYKTLLGKEDLTQEVFAQANLRSEADMATIRDYIEGRILDSEVRVTVDDATEVHQIRDLLTTKELTTLKEKINEAFDEFTANGRTSRYTKLVNEYESMISRLLGENERIRDRAKLAAQTSKNFNALANKLGLNGRPSQVKTIIKNASSEDVAIVDMFRDIVKGTQVKSETGLSTSPLAAEKLMNFANDFTYEKYGHTYMWDEGIRMELAAIKFLASEYTIRHKDGTVTTRIGFHPNTELDIETQRHINNLLKCINSKLNQETYRIYQRNQAIAGDSVSLYSVTSPTKRVPIIGKAIDTAESFATYAANYIGKENPAYDVLVSDWTKANGTQLSYQQKYTDASNKILQEEGFKPSKGLNFLKKKVEFQGHKITKGEAASIYFSALTKQGIADGTNELVIYNPKTESKSIVIKLSGDADLATLKGLFSESEFRVLERLQKEVLGGTMQKDFVSWFQKKYGYTPDTSDDYFMLSADTSKADLSTERGTTGAGAMVMGTTWGRARGRQTYNGSYRIMDFRTQFAQYGNDLAHHIGYSDYNDRARILLMTKVETGGKKLSLSELLGRNAPNWSGEGGWQRYFEYIATDSKAYDKGSGNGLLGKIIRGGQTSVLGLNPRSMAKQWLSDFTVMGDVGIGTYLKSKTRVPYNLTHYKQIRDFMINADSRIDTTNPDFAEYEPYFALIRERLQNKGAVKGEISSEFVGKVSDITLKGMSFFDEANNVINVWAVAETLAHDYDGLKYGTDANRLQAMKYFVDLVFRTQSNNNAMYVSQLRSGYAGQVQKLLFGMFASDNQNKLQQVDAITREFYQANKRRKAYQEIIDDVNSTPAQIEAANKAIAYIDKNYSKKAWGKKASGVAAGLALGGLGAALINETFDRILAKKDKDGNPKKLADGLDWKTIIAEAPLEAFVNWIPYVGTIANAVENNSDVSILTADRITGLTNAVTTLTSALQSGDSAKIGKAITSFVMTYGELLGIPLNNIYKYTKGIIRNASEATYIKAFGWMDGLKSNNVTASYKNMVEKNDITGAAEVLSINYSLYKTGTTDRDVLVEIAKLSRDGFNAVAKNIPDYITNEEGEKVVLSDDQKVSFGQYYSKSNATVTKLIKSSYYQSMDSENKAKTIKKAYDYFYDLAKYHAMKVDPTSRIGKLLAYTDGNYDIASTLLLIQQNSLLVDTKRMSKKEQAIRLVNKQAMSRQQKLLTLYLMGYGVAGDNKKVLQRYLISKGFSKKQAESFVS